MQSRDWEAKKTMEFKGTLIVVKDCKKALKFYQDMFGYELIRDHDGNMELSDNLSLQEEKYWERFTGKRVIPQSHQTELYIEKNFSWAAAFHLDTPCWNERTNAFYKRLGYRTIKVEDGFVFYRKRKNEPMEKLTENMIRFAESKLGSTEYAGWCLAFVEDALEISNHIEILGGDSAKESCELYKDALRGGVPERGAFVFYDCLCPSENGPVNWGHCGISFGDGRVIHAWDMVRIDDYLAIEKLTALTGDHPKYLGWVALERVLKQKP